MKYEADSYWKVVVSVEVFGQLLIKNKAKIKC